MRELLIIGAGGLALGIAGAWAIGRGISRPIDDMANTMLAVAAGDLTVTVCG